MTLDKIQIMSVSPVTGRYIVRKFCSVCGRCNKPIVPKKGETRVQKLRALGKDFHLQCFKCEVGE